MQKNKEYQLNVEVIGAVDVCHHCAVLRVEFWWDGRVVLELLPARLYRIIKPDGADDIM